MLLILLIIVVLVLFSGGLAYPSGRSILWPIVIVLLLLWAFGVLR